VSGQKASQATETPQKHLPNANQTTTLSICNSFYWMNY